MMGQRAEADSQPYSKVAVPERCLPAHAGKARDNRALKPLFHKLLEVLELRLVAAILNAQPNSRGRDKEDCESGRDLLPVA